VPRNDVPRASIVDGTTQGSDGPGKQLSHLVFKVNANANAIEGKDGPMVDLPSTFPDGMQSFH
jgi:hypothetical protein